ncbi:MAG: hypothetical protein JO250_23250 [Armatimonadetes bacterium]|nr:hypothetical protein [Armatimonadota bacterium]
MPDRKQSLWQPLYRFRDAAVPKLHNLRRARAAGLRVPPTWWVQAADADEVGPPMNTWPLIVRSGSPAEDTEVSSQAGQLVSAVARGREEFGDALRRVMEALDGKGVVFAQTLVQAEEAGVAFFDGFYYERAASPGGNAALTSGQARGEVTRGHLRCAEAWSEWLDQVYRVFGRPEGAYARLDIEWARDTRGYVLLQVRPALFPVVRNPTLSLANHKEILGDPPSPWIVSALGEAGPQVVAFFAQAEPAVRGWDETYSVVLAERAWINFSFFFRLMDGWGAPRAWITEGVGGEAGGPADARFLPWRLARALPRLARLQRISLRAARDADRALEEVAARIEAAQGMEGLFAATVAALVTAIQTNFAIGSVLSGVVQIRKALRVPGAGRVVTQAMMEEYGRLATLPDAAAREAALDEWLARYGHRGPLESDPARPRFSELRETLRRDLAQSVPPGKVGAWRAMPLQKRWLRPLFRMDERREWFRDGLMRRWQRLRERLLDEGARLAAAGALEAAEDVFWLRGEDIQDRAGLRAAVASNKARGEQARTLHLPLTASREEIIAAMTRAEPPAAGGGRTFRGIGLGGAVFEGRAVKAHDLLALLDDVAAGRARLGPDAILVVPALEPSWAVVFGRVGGVVAEIGGELSHASILLREARRPAVVNCAGVWDGLPDGERLRLDAARGTVERLTPGAGAG